MLKALAIALLTTAVACACPAPQHGIVFTASHNVTAGGNIEFVDNNSASCHSQYGQLQSRTEGALFVLTCVR